MAVVPQTEPIRRTIPYVGHNSDAGIAMTSGQVILIAFSVDVGQGSQTDENNGPTGWPGAAIEVKYHAAYRMNLTVSAVVTNGLLVELRGAPHNAGAMPLAGQWFVSEGVPLYANMAVPNEFSTLTITNVGAGIAIDVFWEYHMRSAG